MTTGPLPRLCRLADLIDELTAEAAAAEEARRLGVPRGPVVPLPKLNAELGGRLPAGDVVSLHAGPGVGKSALVLQTAASCGAPALLVTTELSPRELLRRLIAQVTGQNLGRLRDGVSASEIAQLATQAAAAAPRLVIADATVGWPSPEWLAHAAHATRGDAPHLLIAIDSLHTWADGSPTLRAVSEYDRLNEAVDALGALARSVAAPVLAVVERNRAAMRTGGLSAGAGTRSIEYASGVVLGLDRVSDVPNASGEMLVKVTIEKNRYGAPGRKIDCAFHGARQFWRET